MPGLETGPHDRPVTPAAENRGVFVSYSHRDSEWLQQLQTHLKPLDRLGAVCYWDDTRIRPGDDWYQLIESAIAAARVAVLLVSPHFLASDFIRDHELPVLVEASRTRGLAILQVVLSPCRFWSVPELSRFQTVNKPDRPLVDCGSGERDRVWVDLAEAVEAALRPPGKRAWAAVHGGPVLTNKLAIRCGRRNVCLLALTEVNIGKQRGNDIVLRAFHGPNAEARTDGISRKHAALVVTGRGAVWRNLDCAGGTRVGARALPAGAEIDLTHGAVVSPAGAVPIRCELNSQSPILGEEDLYRELAGGVLPVPGPVCGVRLLRQDPAPWAEEYHVVPWGALLGSGSQCGVKVEGAAPVHARLLHLGGGFWLEPAPGQSLELVGRGTVPPDHLVPLRPGQEFRAGTARFAVAGHGQWGVDLDPPE